MKSLLVLLASATCATLSSLGQSPGASPAPAAARPSASPGNAGDAASSVPLPGQPSGPALEKTMPLIPETAPSPSAGLRGAPTGPARHARSGVSATNTFEVEQNIRLNIRIREAQTRATGEPAIQAAWVAAHETRTDPDRRAALKVYYDRLYDRMIQIDPSIADLANARRQACIGRMYNVRLGEAVPADDPFATPIPAGGGKNPPLNEPLFP